MNDSLVVVIYFDKEKRDLFARTYSIIGQKIEHYDSPRQHYDLQNKLQVMQLKNRIQTPPFNQLHVFTLALKEKFFTHKNSSLIEFADKLYDLPDTVTATVVANWRIESKKVPDENDDFGRLLLNEINILNDQFHEDGEQYEFEFIEDFSKVSQSIDSYALISKLTEIIHETLTKYDQEIEQLNEENRQKDSTIEIKRQQEKQRRSRIEALRGAIYEVSE